ncbi:EamA family transporter [Thermus scotoductus]|uniref:EamA family transporter n=1 Tax=Thermus scotoductus TaxID=37636 RepID=A0A430S7C5_THESC|nr:DMT family transporter [Thermus scotoductus]RTG94358.1 EamA family transporter [Thermus scotoductus]RTH07533.1 EamA family transporter [Thermus scotoductus]RTH09249.1 EamA family transporter [Thermus scotoductus]RTH09352.1 EamA family transporter [Thermus scotoductus]RTH31379.1 EamA family transporter [Thermus scotoductus]
MAPFYGRGLGGFLIIGPVSRLAFQEGLTPLAVAFFRAGIAWVFFGLHALLLRQVRVERRDALPLLLFGLVGVSLFYGSYQLAVVYGGAALASVLLYTAPAWVALLSLVVLKEPLDRTGLLAVALTLLGVGLMGVGGGSGVRVLSLALFFGLLSGFTYALYYIFGKLYLPRYATPTLFLYALPVGALGLLPWVEFAPLSLRAMEALLFLGVFSTYGAYLAYYAGLKRLPATRASVVATLEPVVANLFAFLLFREVLSLWAYLGAGLVLLAVVLTVRR